MRLVGEGRESCVADHGVTVGRDHPRAVGPRQLVAEHAGRPGIGERRLLDREDLRDVIAAHGPYDEGVSRCCGSLARDTAIGGWHAWEPRTRPLGLLGVGEPRVDRQYRAWVAAHELAASREPPRMRR